MRTLISTFCFSRTANSFYVSNLWPIPSHLRIAILMDIEDIWIACDILCIKLSDRNLEVKKSDHETVTSWNQYTPIQMTLISTFYLSKAANVSKYGCGFNMRFVDISTRPFGWLWFRPSACRKQQKKCISSLDRYSSKSTYSYADKSNFDSLLFALFLYVKLTAGFFTFPISYSKRYTDIEDILMPCDIEWVRLSDRYLEAKKRAMRQLLININTLLFRWLWFPLATCLKQQACRNTVVALICGLLKSALYLSHDSGFNFCFWPTANILYNSWKSAYFYSDNYDFNMLLVWNSKCVGISSKLCYCCFWG